jgi:hypothetical protein
MATPGVSDGVVLETDEGRYVGQVRTGNQTRHGRGTLTWKKDPFKGDKYEGEWKDGKQSGQGVYTWADGTRYEGEWKDSWMSGRFENGRRSGRGVLWLPDERTYDGAWAGDRPLKGTAMEPDGALSRATFNGETYLGDGWYRAQRVPVGRIVSGRPPPGGSGGPPPEWKGRVELADGTLIAGVFRGLRPHGLATVTEPGGAAYAAEYDGERTFAEGPVPVRKQASLRRRRK